MNKEKEFRKRIEDMTPVQYCNIALRNLTSLDDKEVLKYDWSLKGEVNKVNGGFFRCYNHVFGITIYEYGNELSLPDCCVGICDLKFNFKTNS